MNTYFRLQSYYFFPNYAKLCGILENFWKFADLFVSLQADSRKEKDL